MRSPPTLPPSQNLERAPIVSVQVPYLVIIKFLPNFETDFVTRKQK